MQPYYVDIKKKIKPNKNKHTDLSSQDAEWEGNL